jgi:GMP synthase (glutamine-hydrolysing)
MGMKERRVLVFAHSPEVTLGAFAAVLQQEAIAYDYVRMWLGEAPRWDWPDYSHVVLLGGVMGAYEQDRYEFLRREYGYLERIFAQRIPVLGICLGAQMLAHFLGAKVAVGQYGQEIGWTPIHRLETAIHDPVVGHLPKESYFFEWHGDAFELPTGATWLLTGTVYPQQGFRYGERVWGVQFHPEVTRDMIQSWWAEAPEPRPGAELWVESDRYLPQATALGQELWRRFLARKNGLE